MTFGYIRERRLICGYSVPDSLMTQGVQKSDMIVQINKSRQQVKNDKEIRLPKVLAQTDLRKECGDGRGGRSRGQTQPDRSQDVERGSNQDILICRIPLGALGKLDELRISTFFPQPASAQASNEICQALMFILLLGHNRQK